VISGAFLFFMRTLAAQYQEQERYGWYSLLYLFYSASITLFLLGAMAFGIQPPLSVILLVHLAVAAVCGLGCLGFILRHTPGVAKIQPGLVARIFTLGKWITAVSVFYYLFQRIDMLLLARYADLADVGVYASGAQTVMLYSLFAGSISAIFLPKSVQAVESPGHFRAYLREVFLPIGLIIAAMGLCVAFAETLIPLIFGPRYVNGVTVFQVLTLGWAFQIVYLPFQYLFYVLDNPRQRFLLEVGKVALAGAMIAVLVPFAGAIGAAWAVSIVSVLNCLCSVLLLAPALRSRFASAASGPEAATPIRSQGQGGLMRTVLILEDIPSHNKGEGALFFGIVESLSALGEKRVSLLSSNPDEDRRHYGSHASIIDARGVMPAHIVHGQGSAARKLLNYTAFILGHIGFGLAFQVLGRGALRLFRHPVWQAYLDHDLGVCAHDSFWSPLYHVTLIFLYRSLGKPIVIFGATILPSRAGARGLKKRIAERLTTAAVAAADLVTLRETLSVSALAQAGYSGRPPEVYPDLALLMRPATPEEAQAVLDQEKVPRDRHLVGMAMSRRILRQAHAALAPEASLEKAAAEVARMADHLVETRGVHVVFIPHSVGPTPNLDDRNIGRLILGQCRHREHMTSMSGDYDPRVIKAVCGQLRLAVGTRLHFIIDASCMGVPALLIAQKDDIRCQGIISEMLDAGKFLFPVENLEAEGLGSRAASMLDQHDALSAFLGQAIGEARQRCMMHGSRTREMLLEHGMGG
jgi:polysaccharide pyruvyl transferase WcaK-like protein